MALPDLTSLAAVFPDLSGHTPQVTPSHLGLEPKCGLRKCPCALFLASGELPYSHLGAGAEISKMSHLLKLQNIWLQEGPKVMRLDWDDNISS